MTQGRHIGVVGKAELILVQVQSADRETLAHDEWEAKAVRQNLGALISYAPAIEAFGDEMMIARYRRHLREVARPLVVRDAPENQRNEELRALVAIQPDDAA